MPRFTATDQTGRASISLVARLCTQMGVIWRATSSSDTGFDGEIELTRGDHATAQIIKVQVKAGRSYRRNETAGRFVFQADADHFHYWQAATNPAILIVCDPATERAWWKDLKAWAALHPDLLRSGRKRVKISFDKQRDRFTKDCAEALRQVCLRTLESLLRPPAEPDPPTPEPDLLKPRHRATRLVGRDADLAGLWSWLTSGEPLSARLLVGEAGAGKTRLAMELLRRVQAERKDWRAGFLTPEGRDRLRADAPRRRSDPAAPPDWTWHVPTLLVVDYAQTLARPLAALLRTLFRQCRAGRPPLRLLLLERVAGDWFEDLLRAEDSDGPGPVRRLFHPPQPVRLTPIPPGPLRRQLLADTLEQAARLAQTTPPPLPAETDATFTDSLNREDIENPLHLMLAALTASEMGLTAALKRGRVELAVDLARKELRRIGRFAPVPNGPGLPRLLEHLAGCATLEHGFTAAELRRAIEEELPALGLAWPGGTGDLEAVLKQALPGEFLPVASVEPDFIGEALVLTALARPDCQAGPDRWTSWCATVRRCAGRDPLATPATVLHAFQNFGSHPEYGEALLAATDHLIQTGLADRDPALLMGIENALPRQTLALCSRAAEVTRRLYQRLKRASAAGRKELKPEVARLANNLAIRWSELGRHQEALAPLRHRRR